MIAKRGITITNYLVSGDPEGIVFAFISNWTGQAIKIPRNLFADSKDLPELNRPGIYFLIGQSEDNPDDKLVYIGEANILRDRLIQHLRDSEKSFAETIVCFSSKDEVLTVSHTKYLEQKLINHVSASKEYRLVNKKEGSIINMPRMMQDEMDTYLDYMKVILPSIGYNVLHVAELPQQLNSADLFTLDIGKQKAFAKLTANGIEVLPGSKMSRQEVVSLSRGYVNLRSMLKDKGIVEEREDMFSFVQPFEFTSPSTAAAVIVGYSVNGRVSWKNFAGKTLKELEEQKMSN